MSTSSTRQIRVLLVDDHALIREGTRQFIEKDDRIDVIGEAETADDAIRLATELEPDVILLDVRLRGGSGIDVARALQRQGSSARVLVMSAYDFGPYIEAFTKAGVRGYMLKDVQGDELLHAIHQVYEGKGVLPGPVAASVLETLSKEKREPTAKQPDKMTVREVEVLELLMQGYRNQDIGGRLEISTRTVETHVANLLGKLGAATRSEAVRKAVEQGYFSAA